MSAPSDRNPRMTSDCCPELDFIQFSGAGGDDRHGALGASWNFHAVSARPGHRLIRPVRFGVSQPLVEPAPPLLPARSFRSLHLGTNEDMKFGRE
jgi:hypothetical protein